MLRLKRESFASRIGFLLVSAGCAIGIGNVWRFPTVTGQYGGGVFVLFYLLFLATDITIILNCNVDLFYHFIIQNNLICCINAKQCPICFLSASIQFFQCFIRKLWSADKFCQRCGCSK